MSNRIPTTVTIAKLSKQFKEMQRGDVVKHVFKYRDKKGATQKAGLEGSEYSVRHDEGHYNVNDGHVHTKRTGRITPITKTYSNFKIQHIHGRC